MEVLLFLTVPAILLFVIFQNLLERNRLLKAQLFLELFEKIKQNETFTKVEQLLEDSESFDFMRLDVDQRENLEEYLQFFDALVATKIPDRFDKREADFLFGRSAELLNRYYPLRNHITENYQNLDEILTLHSQENKKLSGE